MNGPTNNNSNIEPIFYNYFLNFQSPWYSHKSLLSQKYQWNKHMSTFILDIHNSKLMMQELFFYKCYNLALGSRPRQGLAKVWAKYEAWESHFMLMGVQECVREWTLTLPSELPLWEL